MCWNKRIPFCPLCRWLPGVQRIGYLDSAGRCVFAASALRRRWRKWSGMVVRRWRVRQRLVGHVRGHSRSGAHGDCRRRCTRWGLLCVQYNWGYWRLLSVRIALVLFCRDGSSDQHAGREWRLWRRGCVLRGMYSGGWGDERGCWRECHWDHHWIRLGRQRSGLFRSPLRSLHSEHLQKIKLE